LHLNKRVVPHQLQEIGGYARMVDEQLKNLLPGREPLGLYEPINYTIALGGKRLRPALCMLAARTVGGDANKALHPALGIELFHNFTLLHDDIMDAAPLRRGEQTVYVKWNTNTAILSGDAMFVLAYEQIAQVDPTVIKEVLACFNKTALEVCEGQQLDLDFEILDSVSIGDYINMITLKTAVLLAASLKIGALAGGANADQAEHLYQFGLNLGIAFQLHDDILDVFGEPEKVGKQPGGDIIANKKTFLYLKSLELADTESREELIDWYSGPTYDVNEKVPKVKSLFEKAGVLPQAEAEKTRYYTTAIEHLNALDSFDTSALKDFAEALMEREL
jgi:geranylgeranyl diphosphate synthase type II